MLWCKQWLHDGCDYILYTLRDPFDVLQYIYNCVLPSDSNLHAAMASSKPADGQIWRVFTDNFELDRESLIFCRTGFWS